MTFEVDADQEALQRENPRLFAALMYASRDWKVLKVHWINAFGRCTCLAGGQAECASAGKHPVQGNWPELATDDQTMISQIWGETPEANIGIATGNPSGVWVLDVDEGVRKDGTFKQGLDSLIDLISEHDELPETYAVRTGGGGIQYYFAMPESYKIKSVSRGTNNEPALGPEYPDIDLRGDGGMVVAPPSASSRGPYVVEQDVDVVPAPQWLLDLMLQRGLMSPLEEPEDPMPETAQDPAPSEAPVQSEAPGWLEAAIERKLQEIRDCPDGQGNDTINKLSFEIGMYIPNGWITREDAERRLREAAASWEHPHPRAEFTIAHGLTDGSRRPYQTLAHAASAGDTSDAVMAERVATELLAGRFCWAFGLDWLAWNGHVWEMCPDVEVTEVIRAYMKDEVSTSIRQVADNAAARKALVSLLGRSRITSIMLLTRGIVQVRSDRFDAHPDLLNTPGGVVDLRTGEIGPSDPNLYFMKITSVAYRPEAVHEDWNTLALSALYEDVAEWLKVRLGQALTGFMPPDDSMILMQGTGANGKTTITNTVAKAMGSYYSMVPSGALIGKQEDMHALMPFMGARLAVVEELPEGRRLNVTRLKETVGTPRMKGRYMYKNLIEWDASHCLVITTNYIPTVNETDGGTWRRLKMMTFPFRFVKPGKPLESPMDRPGDPQLRQRLATGREQQEACLAWLVQGAMSWYAADKLMPEDPKQIEDDTDGWRQQADLILSVCWRSLLVVDPEAHVTTKDLLGEFNRRIISLGHPGWSDQTFSMRFGQHEETIKARTIKKVIVKNEGLSLPVSWPPRDPDDVSNRYTAWLGVRFKENE